ncbi:MAG: hypothetical protein H8F28_21065 [Fibrella sp.]|nr:hypothetical protein [Armatimonadota bacterium]
MQSVDRYTKVMLTLLVIGIWAMLLRPFFQPTPAIAQSGVKYGVYAQENNIVADREMGVYPHSTFKAKSVSFTVTGDNVGKALLHASANGWKIVSISPNDGGFSIFVQK